MPFKFTHKIILFLVGIILFFVIAFSLCFSIVFVHHATTVEHSRLESRALSLADAISKATPNDAVTSIYNNNFILATNALNQDEIWLIDKNSLNIVGSRFNPSLTYAMLSEAEMNDIQRIFAGQNIHTDDFKDFLNADFTTIGVPIYDTNGQVKAALLLHDKVPTIQDSWYDGLPIIGTCALILLILSILFTKLFITKYVLSLGVINNFCQKILNHDYASQIRTKSTDEIGSLANKLNQLAQYMQSTEQDFRSQKSSNNNLMTKTAYKLHEILKDLKSSTRIISSKIVNADDQKTIKSMQKQLEQLEFMANNMLNLSQLDNNSLALQKELTNLLEILANAIKDSQKYAAEHQITLNLNVDLENHLLLFAGDPVRLKQMFSETLYKALQLYPAKSKLLINVMEDVHNYYIYMQSSNSEISTKQLANMFQQFYQSTPVDDTVLTSMEITIARHLASLHHIKLSFEKQANDYIVFKFTIKK